MDWQFFLFSTSGRFNRARYWLAVLIYVVVTLICFGIGLFLVTSVSQLAAVVLYVGGSVMFLLVVFSGIATGIKRLHDRNKNGFWVIPFLVLPGLLNSASTGLTDPRTGMILKIIALVLGLWALLELGILRGTVGPNQYGPDPVDVPETEVPGPGA